VKIEIKTTRKVLFEKFNIKHEIEDFLLNKLDECEINFLKSKPKSIFYIKNDLYFFEQDFKNGYLWVRNDLIWSVLNSKYILKTEEIKEFILNTLETHLKDESLTPYKQTNYHAMELETHLKDESLTPDYIWENKAFILERQLKRQLKRISKTNCF
jgi:hypothetical protein